MAHEKDINVILRSCAHTEAQNASNETSYMLNRIKHSSGSGVNWDRFQEVQVRRLDARSHDAHSRAVHRLTQKARSLPQDQQQSFLDKGMAMLSGLNDLLRNAFSHLASIVVDAISSVKDLFHQITDFFGTIMNHLVSLIEASVHKVTNWANGTAYYIEKWSPL